MLVFHVVGTTIYSETDRSSSQLYVISIVFYRPASPNDPFASKIWAS